MCELLKSLLDLLLSLFPFAKPSVSPHHVAAWVPSLFATPLNQISHPGCGPRRETQASSLCSGSPEWGQSHLLMHKDSCVPHCEAQDDSLSKKQILFHWMKNAQKFHGTMKSLEALSMESNKV